MLVSFEWRTLRSLLVQVGEFKVTEDGFGGHG